MPFRDIQEFAAALEQRGWLKRIRVPVSAKLEIAEITDRVMKSPGGGPALLFEQVQGSPYPVLINAFGSTERMCLALGVDRLDDLATGIRELLQLPTGGGLLDKLGEGVKLLSVARHTAPKRVRHAPCQEVVESDPDLSRLPILHCWPGDPAPFITFPLVITRDPVTGLRNVGLYRMQVYNRRTTGMHWHLHKDGQRHMDRQRAAGERRMPVAVALGADPVTMYCGSAPLPPLVPELMLAGFLRQAPVELVPCKTVDLEVPAHAEFVLEGYVDLDEERVEGPFGDHTGFYSPAAPYPVFHITCITRKQRPVYPTTIVGRPPMEDVYMGKATERLFLPLLQLVLPEIIDYHMPPAGVFHNCVLVRIRKRYPGHARKVANGLWGLGLMMLSKVIVVVDEDCDVQNVSEVVWKAFANIDPRRDVFFSDGPADDLEHASPAWRYGSKMGIDATRKGPEEGHPRPWPDAVAMSADIRALVDRRWSEYGLEGSAGA